jgi:hypothetical protein
MADNGLTPFEVAIADYKRSLVVAEQASQAEFDNSLLTLSSGGLGLTIIFLKDVVGSKAPVASWMLASCWTAWGISIVAILFSHLTSCKALRRAIAKTDSKEIYLESRKCWWSLSTRILNVLGAISFVAGVVFLIIFVTRNPVA